MLRRFRPRPTYWDVVVTVAAAVVLGGATQASAAFPGRNGKIAFVTERQSLASIFVMGADGSHQHRLTLGDQENYAPAFSPDGNEITFLSYRDGNPEIYVMNADGSDQIDLTNDPASGEFDPAFSANGRRIAFSSGGIWVMRADGGNQHPVTNGFEDFAPAFSPTGGLIAFYSAVGKGSIYTVRPDGSHRHRLAQGTSPTFSPNGKRIAFDTERHGIAVIRLDGTHRHFLAVGIDPTFSPNGKKIAFERGHHGNDEIYVMNADGSHQHDITRNPTFDAGPDWGVRP